MADEAIRSRLTFRRQALEAGDLKQAFSIFFEDGQLLTPGRDTLVGREAIAEYYTALSAKGKLTLEDYDLREVKTISDVIATSQGVFTMVIDGKKQGRYKSLTLWQKVDGEWFVFRSAFNSLE